MHWPPASHFRRNGNTLIADAGYMDSRTVGSFFGPLRPTAAFAAACSATQELRCELSREGGGLTVKVADIPKAITRYFDSVFLAAILRTLRRNQIKPSGQDTLICDAIQRKCSRGVHQITVAELCWAAIQGKLPKQAVEPLLHCLPECEGRQFLRALLDSLDQ